MTSQGAYELARQAISVHSKSFALASRLLGPKVRDAACVVYAWCRRADDAIDLIPPERQGDALARLSQELADVYAGRNLADPILAAFQSVVDEYRIAPEYPQELLLGMKMDVDRTRYAHFDELLHYTYRVAGTVGLMMSHVMGVSSDDALRSAAQMGMAMQLTNICRDVAEDWTAKRLYLPADVLAQVGASEVYDRWPTVSPHDFRRPIAEAVRVLLARADEFYARGDEGLTALDARCAFSIHAARLIYAEIGRALARHNYDPLSGRAVVSTPRKLRLVLRAMGASLVRRATAPPRGITHIPSTRFHFATFQQGAERCT